MNFETILIPILFTIDIFLTYFYLNTYKKNLNGDFTRMEANPIIRFFIRKFGLKKGIFISYPLIFILLIAVLFFISKTWQDILLGAYCMMIIYHYSNFRVLKTTIKQMKEQAKKEKNIK